jgi:hypothetical protein
MNHGKVGAQEFDEKISKKKIKEKWEIFFSLCAHYPCSLLLFAVEQQPWHLHIRSGG